MRSSWRLATTLLTVAAIGLFGVAAVSAADGGRPISAVLTGAAEVNAAGVPNQGDLDGSGTVKLTFNPGTGVVCYAFTVEGVAPLTAAHIHRAPSTAPGPVVIPTPTTSATGGSGCVTADRALIIDILLNPQDYYFNVHNADYPPGALRGQLG